MEFRQLEAYIKVVELGSFSKAAKELHVSQPSVSTYISSLERELNTTLLNRSTKTLSTTLAGQRLLAAAYELIALRKESVDAIRGLGEDFSGEIRIAASSVPASYLLPKILASFHAAYPKVNFKIIQADSAVSVEAVADNQADIGFCGSIIDNPICSFQSFAKEELIFIGPAPSETRKAPALTHQGKQKTKRESFSPTRNYQLEELLYEHNFISRELGSGTRIQYEKFFVDHGIDLRRIRSCVSMGNTQSVINSVARGLGISLVSELAAGDAIAQGQIVKLHCEKRMPKREIYTVLNGRVKHSHLIKLFIQHLNHLDLEG